MLTKVRDAASKDTLFAYDANGNMTKVTDALSRATDYAYDAMNRLTRITSPSGGGTYMTFTYDKEGQQITRQDFNGKTVTYAYDHVGRVTQQTDAVASVTYTFAALGMLSTVTDGLNHTWDYDYGSDFQLTKVTDPVSKKTWYYYDSIGRSTKVAAGSAGTTDPVEYAYSSTTGLLSRVTYTNAGVAKYVNYVYDAAGQLTQITDWCNGDGNGNHYLLYDTAGRLTQYRDYDDNLSGAYHRLNYAYDAADRVTTMTDYHGYNMTYSYTARNQVSTITAPGSKVWDFDYNDIGQRVQVTHANGIVTVYGYDSRNRLTKIEHKNGATVVDGFTYALDSQGEITRVTYQDGAYWDYAYDGRYRLTSALRKNSGGTTLQAHAYVYDAGDNLVSKTVAGTTTVFGYNTANELTTQTVGGTTTTFTYDDWGRTVTKTQGSYTATYGYRFGNKLKVAVSNFPGEPTPVQPNYDGFGRLRSVSVNNGAIVWKYRWAGNQMLSEYDDTDGTWEIEDSKLIYTYVHDPASVAGAPLADLAGTNPSTGTARYYFGDNLGSTRRLRNASKTSLGQYEYQPYGTPYAETGATPKYKFAGMYYVPDLATYYTLNRLYNPTLARWTTRDPLGMVDGPNVYAYVGNNVVVLRDTLGLQGEGEDEGEWAEAVAACKQKCEEANAFMTMVDLAVIAAAMARCGELLQPFQRWCKVAVTGLGLALLNERSKEHKKCLDKCEEDPCHMDWNTPPW
jgi:RHS repeat-associated protein